jgi:drug/metabolite transporter (DMT)-like permease
VSAAEAEPLPAPGAPVRPRASRARGWALALFSTVCYSLAPTLAKAAIDAGTDPVALLTMRMALATALLGGTILATSPGRLRLRPRAVLASLAAGLGNGAGITTFFLSLARLDASIASMIFALSPLVVLVLMALTGERLTRRNLARLALGLSGIYLLLGPGGAVDGLGVVLAFVAVFTVPLHIMFIQWFLPEADGLGVTFYMVSAMLAVSAAWWGLQGGAWQDPGLTGWLLVLGLALVSTYLARLAMFAAVKAIGGGEVGLMAPLETMLTVLWSVAFLSERLSALQWVGGALIVSSAVLAVRRRRALGPAGAQASRANA